MTRARIGNGLLLAVLAALMLALALWQREPWWNGAADIPRITMAALMLTAWLAIAVVFLRPQRREAPSASDDALLILWASQTGFAAQLARHSAQSLNEAGIDTLVLPLEAATPARLQRHARALVIASTTGEGDPPDHALGFVPALQGAELKGLSYAVLALGDHRYDQFCAYGRQLDDALHHAGAQPLFDRVEVDAGDPAALRHWQQHLGQLAGGAAMADWVTPEYQRWRLAERHHLNPGSVGGAVFHIVLTPPPGKAVEWQAGDIIEIGPQQPPARVAAFLASAGLAGDAPVVVEGVRQPLADALARCLLPEADAVRGLAPQALADALKPLPHREYSIASLPADGGVAFALRRMLWPDGSPGLASGWLCDVAPIGAEIDARIRSNPNFHAPDPAAPMILIGNGTGIGGLRAHLRARVAAGAHRNWVLYGERHQNADGLYGDELEGWQRSGALTHLDRTYSRDGNGPRYVQDALRAHAGRLREWLDAGAAIYVCGSLKGMAPGVDAVLVDVIGQAGVDSLAETGRYRRDVY